MGDISRCSPRDHRHASRRGLFCMLLLLPCRKYLTILPAERAKDDHKIEEGWVWCVPTSSTSGPFLARPPYVTWTSQSQTQNLDKERGLGNPSAIQSDLVKQ